MQYLCWPCFNMHIFTLLCCFRVRPQPSKETSYSAANIWLRSSPNSTAPGPRLQTRSRSTSTSQTSKIEMKSRSNLFLSKGHELSPTPGWLLMMFLCATGFWCSSSKTKCAWNSSREAPRMATARPASARTTGCWRCRCPWRHSAAPSLGSPVLFECSDWGGRFFFFLQKPPHHSVTSRLKHHRPSAHPEPPEKTGVQ